MSYADEKFVEMCNDILENGTDTQGELVRPHWEDGSPAYTIKKFGVINRYDLRKEFPAMTLRKTAIKSAIDEILWIWQKHSNNIHDLNSHIWDEWADDNGSIGKAYGYQMGIRDRYTNITEERLKNAFPDNYHIVEIDAANREMGDPEKVFEREDGKVTVAVYKNGAWYMSQIDKAIYDLKNTPYSRRILTNIYNFSDLSEMNLYPCAYSMTFNVTQRKGEDKLTLNGILNQRSQDVLAANNWNVVQYSALLYMLAQVCDMNVGEFIHVIADAHIYDRHVDIIKELVQRPQYDAPVVTLDPDIKDFYDFTKDSFKVENYVTGEQIKNIPIAV